MATSSYAKTLLGSLPAEVRAPLERAFDYVFNRNLCFGPIDADAAQAQTTNLLGRFVKVQTSSVTNQEVAVAHGLGRTPNIIWPVISPRVVNARFLGDLTVTKAADSQRIYLSSASTGVTTWVYCE